MYATAQACTDRPKFATRKEYERAFGVQTDRGAMVAFLRHHFRTNPPRRPHAAHAPVPAAAAAAAAAAAELRFPAIRSALASPTYSNVDLDSVLTTFRYLHDRHRQGIYVSIRGNRVAHFVLFNNPRFRNPLARFLKLEGSPRPDGAINPNSEQWNNFDCLVSNVVRRPPLTPEERAKQGYEPTYNYSETRVMLELTCAHRRVADCDFFVNVWDQLVLRRDLCIPHLNVTGDRLVPITEFRGRRMCPIVSLCYADAYLDLPFVFPDDVSRVTQAYFIPRCANPFADQDVRSRIVTDWRRKPHASAVFRGTATGCGWTVETNPRLYAAALTDALEKQQQQQQQQQQRLPKPIPTIKGGWGRSTTTTKTATSASAKKAAASSQPLQPPQPQPPLVDARLVGTHEFRFKKHAGDEHVRFFTDPRVVPLQSDAHRLDLGQQSLYKYVLDLPGNVVAYRIAGMFGLGSVVIAVLHERCRPWMFPLLRSGHNCIVLRDATQLARTVEWCRAHDAECAAIARRGLALFHDAFQKDAIMDYVALLLNGIARNTRV
jgi:hypothetical protein